MAANGPRPSLHRPGWFFILVTVVFAPILVKAIDGEATDVINEAGEDGELPASALAVFELMRSIDAATIEKRRLREKSAEAGNGEEQPDVRSLAQDSDDPMLLRHGEILIPDHLTGKVLVSGAAPDDIDNEPVVVTETGDVELASTPPSEIAAMPSAVEATAADGQGETQLDLEQQKVIEAAGAKEAERDRLEAKLRCWHRIDQSLGHAQITWPCSNDDGVNFTQVSSAGSAFVEKLPVAVIQGLLKDALTESQLRTMSAEQLLLLPSIALSTVRSDNQSQSVSVENESEDAATPADTQLHRGDAGRVLARLIASHPFSLPICAHAVEAVSKAAFNAASDVNAILGSFADVLIHSNISRKCPSIAEQLIDSLSNDQGGEVELNLLPRVSRVYNASFEMMVTLLSQQAATTAMDLLRHDLLHIDRVAMEELAKFGHLTFGQRAVLLEAYLDSASRNHSQEVSALNHLDTPFPEGRGILGDLSAYIYGDASASESSTAEPGTSSVDDDRVPNNRTERELDTEDVNADALAAAVSQAAHGANDLFATVLAENISEDIIIDPNGNVIAAHIPSHFLTGLRHDSLIRLKAGGRQVAQGMQVDNLLPSQVKDLFDIVERDGDARFWRNVLAFGKPARLLAHVDLNQFRRTFDSFTKALYASKVKKVGNHEEAWNLELFYRSVLPSFPRHLIAAWRAEEEPLSNSTLAATPAHSNRTSARRSLSSGRVPLLGLSCAEIRDISPTNITQVISYHNEQLEARAAAAAGKLQAYPLTTRKCFKEKLIDYLMLKSELYGSPLSADDFDARLLRFLSTADIVGSGGQILSAFSAEQISAAGPALRRAIIVAVGRVPAHQLIAGSSLHHLQRIANAAPIAAKRPFGQDLGGQDGNGKHLTFKTMQHLGSLLFYSEFFKMSVSAHGREDIRRYFQAHVSKPGHRLLCLPESHWPAVVRAMEAAASGDGGGEDMTPRIESWTAEDLILFGDMLWFLNDGDLSRLDSASLRLAAPQLLAESRLHARYDRFVGFEGPTNFVQACESWLGVSPFGAHSKAKDRLMLAYLRAAQLAVQPPLKVPLLKPNETAAINARSGSAANTTTQADLPLSSDSLLPLSYDSLQLSTGAVERDVDLGYDRVVRFVEDQYKKLTEDQRFLIQEVAHELRAGVRAQVSKLFDVTVADDEVSDKIAGIIASNEDVDKETVFHKFILFVKANYFKEVVSMVNVSSADLGMTTKQFSVLSGIDAASGLPTHFTCNGTMAAQHSAVALKPSDLVFVSTDDVERCLELFGDRNVAWTHAERRAFWSVIKAKLGKSSIRSLLRPGWKFLLLGDLLPSVALDDPDLLESDELEGVYASALASPEVLSIVGGPASASLGEQDLGAIVDRARRVHNASRAAFEMQARQLNAGQLSAAAAQFSRAEANLFDFALGRLLCGLAPDHLARVVDDAAKLSYMLPLLRNINCTSDKMLAITSSLSLPVGEWADADVAAMGALIAGLSPQEFSNLHSIAAVGPAAWAKLSGAHLKALDPAKLAGIAVEGAAVLRLEQLRDLDGRRLRSLRSAVRGSEDVAPRITADLDHVIAAKVEAHVAAQEALRRAEEEATMQANATMLNNVGEASVREIIGAHEEETHESEADLGGASGGDAPDQKNEKQRHERDQPLETQPASEEGGDPTPSSEPAAENENDGKRHERVEHGTGLRGGGGGEESKAEPEGEPEASTSAASAAWPENFPTVVAAVVTVATVVVLAVIIGGLLCYRHSRHRAAESEVESVRPSVAAAARTANDSDAEARRRGQLTSHPH